MKVVVCTVLAVFIHMVLGWQWTALAGVLCGMMMAQRGWLWGGVSVGAGWAIMVLINYIAAPQPVLRMLDITGQILGNLPGAMVVVLTVFIGAVLGLLGGGVGAQLVQLIPSLRLFKQAV